MGDTTFEYGKQMALKLRPDLDELLREYEYEIDAGTTAEQLHQYLDTYNWDDGFSIPYLIVCHPNCELATAVHAFWLSDAAVYFEDDFKNKEVAPWQQNWKDFVIFITERILNHSYNAGFIELPSRWRLSNARLLYRKKHGWQATDGIPDIFYGLGGPWEENKTPRAIILMGLQASGKSTFCQQRLSQGYVRVNLDTLHTRNKEAKLLEECLGNRMSFVVDNTNPTPEDRKRYIEAARAHGYRVEGYFFRSVVKECVERNSRREGKACVPSKAIAFTSNRLVLPSCEEGFDQLYFVYIKDGEFVVEQWKEEENDGF